MVIVNTACLDDVEGDGHGCSLQGTTHIEVAGFDILGSLMAVEKHS